MKQRMAAVSLRLILISLVAAGHAMASSSFLSSTNVTNPGFNAVYMGSLSGSNASCNICHSSGGGTPLNAYGKDWAAAHNSGMTTLNAFRAIEGMNSDNDPTGSTNLVEINASTQPGWTPGPNNTFYNLFTLAVVATNQNPPAIAGSLDPAPAANRPPVLAPIGAKSVSEGQTLTFTATATDPDNNALTFSAGNLPTGATFSPGGVFSWTPSFSQAGNYNVTITVTDNGTPALSDFEIVTITVGNVNRPPTLNPIGAKSVNEGQALTFTATASDPDGDTLTFSASGLPTGAALTPGGVFTWTPTFSQGGSNYNVTITVTDNGSPALSASETFTITVGNVNRPPVLSPIGSKTVSQGQTLAFIVTATDPDNNTVTFSAGNLPAGATLTPTGAFSWTPTSSQTGNFNVTITATDNGTPPLSASETFTITVGAVNRPPTLNPIGAKTVNEGQLLTFTATGSDPDGNTLTFSASNLPTGATLTPGGVFSWTPGFNQAGPYSVTITVTDNGSPALSASETFTITVGNVNRPPVLSPSPVGTRTVTAGQTLTIAFNASDPDGDPLTFSSANLPAGATLTPTGANSATFSFTPAAAGTFSNVTIIVSDGSLTDSEVFNITVNAVTANRPPVLTNPGSKTVVEGQLLSFTLTASDPDGNSLTFASSNLPTGATLSPNGAFAWTPAVGQAGSYSVTVTVTDNGVPPLTSAPQTFLITVQAPSPTSSLRIRKAEWDDSELKVEGTVTPGRVTVTVINADTGQTLGSTMADSKGKWELELKNVRPAPCRVQAKAGNQSSAVVTVKGGPCRGQGDEVDDHDDDDNGGDKDK